MQVTLNKEGSVTVVRTNGPIIASELEPLDVELERLAHNWSRRVIIDLSETPFLDSAGLELLCRTHRTFSRHGLQLKLSGLTDMTQKIFDLTRLSRRFQIFPDTLTAVRSFL